MKNINFKSLLPNAVPSISRFSFAAAAFVALLALYDMLLQVGALYALPTTRIAALSLVATIAILTAWMWYLAGKQRYRTSALAGMFLGLWLAAGLLLALFASRSIAVSATRAGQLLPVDDAMFALGAFVFAALPALPVLPLSVVLVSYTTERQGQYSSAADAIGVLLLGILKIALAIAMLAFEMLFGLSLGLPPIVAFFAATLNAVAFSAVLAKLVDAGNRKQASSVARWGTVSLFYALTMALIAGEAILRQARSVGANVTVAFPTWFDSLAQTVFISSIGISAVLLSWLTWRNAAESLPQQRPVVVRVAENVAGIANSLRDAKRALFPQPRAEPKLSFASEKQKFQRTREDGREQRAARTKSDRLAGSEDED